MKRGAGGMGTSMDVFGLQIPTKVIFGNKSFGALQSVAPELGRKAILLMTGEDLEKVGTMDRALTYLKNAGVETVVFNAIEPNPKTYNIDAAVKVMKREGCDLVIGLGGGSAMDAAKAVALIAKNGGSVNDYILDGYKTKIDIDESFPTICISTTAGTGSEVTKYAVITEPVTKNKPGFGYDCMYPNVSIVDPELTLTLPIGVTASTGIDVFFHAMEAYIATIATPFTDLCAIEAMRLVGENLYKVYRDGADLVARANMAWANTLGGLTITMSSTVAIHAMGHAVSGIKDVSHGRGLCTVARAYLDFTYDANVQRYATIARILGAPGYLSDEEAAEKCGTLFSEYIKRFNMPTCLSDVGLRVADIEKIAKDTMYAMEFPLSVSLKKLSYDDIIYLLRKSI